MITIVIEGGKPPPETVGNSRQQPATAGTVRHHPAPLRDQKRRNQMARQERETELGAAAVARVDHLLDRAIDSLQRARRQTFTDNKVGAMRAAVAHVSNAFVYYEAAEAEAAHQARAAS